MRYFIYFRNSEYAKILTSQLTNSCIKNTESEVLGVDPWEHDIFIIDVHYGVGDMSDLHGLNVAYKLFISIRKINTKIWILSWFTKEYLIRNNQFAKELSSSSKIEFFQLPLI